MDNRGSIRRWPDRPLCRRYAVVVFNTVAVTVHDGLGRSGRRVQWAFGRLVNGEYESLGAWLRFDRGTPIAQIALANLRARGAEFVGAFVGADLHLGKNVVAAVFPGAQTLESHEQFLAQAIATVPPRHRQGIVDALHAAEIPDMEARHREIDKLLLLGPGKKYPKVVQLWNELLARSEAQVEISSAMKVLVRSVDRTTAEVSERLAREIQRHGAFQDADAALDFVSSVLLRVERRLDRARAADSAAREASPLIQHGGESLQPDAAGVPTLA